MTDVKTYQSYRGLPTLAGLASIADAAKPGLSVDACVARLKRYHYAFVRFHEIFTARITAEPIYELKTGFSHHAYLCSEHVAALRARIGEMREPPLGLEEIPHAALQILFDEILAAPTTEALLLGVYEIALPALDAALADHLRDTNPLADAPSVRVIRFARFELEDMLEFGHAAIGCLVDDAAYEAHRAWLADLLAMSTAMAGDGRALNGEMKRHYSARPYVYDRIPKRDERFHDVWNQGVNAESFLYNPDLPAKPKTLMMLYKRLREIDVPEMMASIITETKGKPWEYYRDLNAEKAKMQSVANALHAG